MAVLPSQAKRRVAVATSLGADLDPGLGSAGDGSLNVLDLGRHDYRCRRVRQALVERSDVLVPGRAALCVDGDVGRLEAVIDGSTGDEAAGGQEKRRGKCGSHVEGQSGSTSRALCWQVLQHVQGEKFYYPPQTPNFNIPSVPAKIPFILDPWGAVN